MVIGADGVRSAVRGMLGLPGKPEYARHMVWRAMIPRSEWVTGINVFAGAGDVHAGVIPLSADSAYVFMTEHGVEPGALPEEELATRMRELMAEYTGKPAELRALITDPRNVVRRPAHVTLIGGGGPRRRRHGRS